MSKKYTNKEGISLSYTNDNDIHQQLVKEIVREAIKILDFAPSYINCENANKRCKKFLKTNFDIIDD